MNLVADQRSERLVDELVACKRTDTVELRCDDERLEMGIVVAHHADNGIFEASLDEALDFGGLHGVVSLLGSRARPVRANEAAQCNRKKPGFPMRWRDCV